MTNLKWFLILAGAGLLGMLLGYFVLQAGVYFVSWEAFPAPPAGTVELLTYKGGQLVSRTANGETYDFTDGRWLRSDWSKSHIITRPCLGGLIGLFIGYLIIKWSQRRRAMRAAGSHI